jgi:hypothetical protein
MGGVRLVDVAGPDGLPSILGILATAEYGRDLVPQRGAFLPLVRRQGFERTQFPQAGKVAVGLPVLQPPGPQAGQRGASYCANRRSLPAGRILATRRAVG